MWITFKDNEQLLTSSQSAKIVHSFKIKVVIPTVVAGPKNIKSVGTDKSF